VLIFPTHEKILVYDVAVSHNHDADFKHLHFLLINQIKLKKKFNFSKITIYNYKSNQLYGNVAFKIMWNRISYKYEICAIVLIAVQFSIACPSPDKGRQGVAWPRATNGYQKIADP